jgi:nicotinamidase/pyrazinamidase
MSGVAATRSGIRPGPGDALIVVDMQKDFLSGGSLAVPHGSEVVPVLNDYMARFHALALPIFATRCWHPPGHCSFAEQGGPWPPHCIAGSNGSEFGEGLEFPATVEVISKGTRLEKDAYSGFQETELDERLKRAGVRRVFVGGLAQDVCVLNTVRDAAELGYAVCLLTDATRAVNVQPDDGAKALAEMQGLGVVPVDRAGIDA